MLNSILQDTKLEDFIETSIILKMKIAEVP